MTFEDFKNIINTFLDNNGYSYDEIKYVTLTNDFWITIQDLMLIDYPPKVLDLDNLIHFKIVLNDYKWISYDYICNSFIITCPPVKPPKKYFIPKISKQLTLGDFITKHQQNYLSTAM